VGFHEGSRTAAALGADDDETGIRLGCGRAPKTVHQPRRTLTGLVHARDGDGNNLVWRAQPMTLAVAERNALHEPSMRQEPKAAPPSGEGRGRQTGTLLSPVLEEKYRTLLSEPVRLCGSTYSMIR